MKLATVCSTIAIGFLAGALTVRADSFSELEGTIWKTGFVGEAQGFQIQFTRSFKAHKKLVEVARVLLIHPLFESAFVVESHMAYEIGEPVSFLPDTRALDLVFETVYEMPLDERTVNQRNRSNYCEINNWEIGVKREITGRRCGEDDENIVSGQRAYDIMQVQGNNAVFGKGTGTVGHDGMTPQTRRDVLDQEKVFVKQP